MPAGRRVALPLRPLDVSALARIAGLPVTHGGRGGPVKARPAALASAMSVNDAFRAVMAANLAHLLANERGVLARADPEYLHQMRVALRRLRSALDVFSPPLPEPKFAPAAGGLAWLASRLGPARDWDVFMTVTLPLIEAEFSAHPGLRAFRARCRTLRRRAGAKARRAVRSSRYRQLTLTLSAWLGSEGWLTRLSRSTRAGPVGDHARAVLEARYRRVRKRGRGLDKLSAAELHRLRIAIKKFRYAADFFAGLYGRRRVRETLKRLARLQDLLGEMNDAATAVDHVKQGFGRPQDGNALEARGILLGWSRGRAAASKRELRSAWTAFCEAEKFW